MTIIQGKKIFVKHEVVSIYPMISIINNTKEVSPTNGINNWQVNVDAT